MHRALLALSAVLVAGLVLAPAASAQAPAPTTLTFKELDKGSTFSVVDLPPRAPRSHGFPTRFSQGDMLVFSNPLRDSANQPFGHLRVSCFTTVGGAKGARFACLGVFSFPNGQVWATATTSPNSTSDSGAVIGGTGAYANMRGTFVSTHTKTGSDDTITLVP
jgi:hypothetical protein